MSVCCLLVLFSSIRGFHVGIDLEYYLPGYRYIGKASWSSMYKIGWEYGYVIYNKILNYLSTNERMLLASTSFIVIGSYSYYIYKYSQIPWLSFFIFIAMGFYASTFNLLRQMMAMSIIMYSLKYIEKRHFIKYLIGVCCAMLFHVSAICTLLLYPFMKVRITCINFIGLTAILFLLFNVFGKYILNFFIANLYTDYTLGQVNVTGINMLIFLFIVTLAAIVLTDITENDIHIHMIALACLLQFLALDFSMMARIVVYFSVSMMIVIPNTIKEMKVGEDVKICIQLGVCLLALLFFLMGANNASSSKSVLYEFM